MASENTASIEQRAQGLLVSEVSMRMWVVSIDAKIRGCREDVAGSMGAFQVVESIRKRVVLDPAEINNKHSLDAICQVHASVQRDPGAWSRTVTQLRE